MKNLTTNKKAMSTKTLVMYALLTAIVVVLQLIAEFMPKVGPCSLSFVLVPIVIGSALCDWKAGAWLGFVFALVVLCCPSTGFFYAFSVPATIAIVILKGIASGAISGLLFNLFKKKSRTFAAILAAIICPIVNTGIFILGCFAFFLPDLTVEAAKLGFENAIALIFLGLALFNFLFELISNIILCPVIVRLLNIRKKQH